MNVQPSRLNMIDKSKKAANGEQKRKKTYANSQIVNIKGNFGEHSIPLVKVESNHFLLQFTAKMMQQFKVILVNGNVLIKDFGKTCFDRVLLCGNKRLDGDCNGMINIVLTNVITQMHASKGLSHSDNRLEVTDSDGDTCTNLRKIMI